MTRHMLTEMHTHALDWMKEGIEALGPGPPPPSSFYWVSPRRRHNPPIWSGPCTTPSGEAYQKIRPRPPALTE